MLTTENFTAVADLGCAIPCQSNPDIVFVIDSSGSIGVFHFQQALSFTANLVSEFALARTSHELESLPTMVMSLLQSR